MFQLLNLFFVAVQDGSTALLTASCQGRTEIVKMLLADSRVDVNRLDEVRCEQYL